MTYIVRSISEPVEESVAGLANVSDFSRDNPRWCACVHEASHCIAFLATGTALYRVEVDEDNGGCCRSGPPSDDGDASFASSECPRQYMALRKICGVTPPMQWVKRRLINTLAGPRGTLKLRGDFRGCAADFADAQAYLRLLAISKKRREALLWECEREAGKIVNHEYPYVVFAVASCLYRKSPLYSEEICAIIRSCGPRGLWLLGEAQRRM